jgi:succinoglycan biosynthesis transport protein ExoP
MYPPSTRGATAADIWAYLVGYPKRWLIPAAVVAVVVGAYALLKPNVYEASLALMMRNEVSTDAQSPGKFRHEDEMKISEETVMEVALSHGVLSAALKQVGPPIDARVVGAWPSDEAVESLRGAIRVAPPKGAEFGKTEIFYLKASDRDPRRALALVEAVYEQLRASLGGLRDARARGIVDELEKVVALSDADLQQGTRRLKEMEKDTGSDLLELRMVYQGTAMDGELSKTVFAGQSELRQWRSVQAANREMLRLLQATQQDPQQLVVAPAPLLESQPTLRQLKQGLVEAQLRASVLAGTVTEGHPQLVVARQAEQDIKRVIFQEVAAAIRGVEAEIQLTDGRIRAAEEQLSTQDARVKHLGAMRAEYSNLVDQVEHHRTELDLAKHYLAESRANQASSHSSSVINRVDAPEGSSTPVGPSRAATALMGLVGGLLAGFGVLYLTVPPREPRYVWDGRFQRRAVADVPYYPTAGYPDGVWRPELSLPLYQSADPVHKPR